jgi:rifampicin phosphotransferase
MAERYVLDLQETDRTQVAVVGGKGAHLGELWRLEDIRVPPGFCVTSDAFRRMLADAPATDDVLDRLSRLSPDEREPIRVLSAEVRDIIEAIPVPERVAAAITRAVERLGEETVWAVRSSATAEDLPTASFAGQQDTWLNVAGSAAILRHVSRCWASLFTERAVTYRLRNGFDHRKVAMAVVVQRMVVARAAGVLFTADPVSGNRRITSVEATFGLGEALVSGRVNADVYQVRDDVVVARSISAKQLAILPALGGGTEELPIDAGLQEQPALTDAQVLRLAALGRRIAAHFGTPQDIEWCLAEGDFHVVQSRPITTLFPVPTVGDDQLRVYVSVGHQQMMTDPMKPLGLSIWQMTTPRPMAEAGGRLFVDVTPILAMPEGRAGLMATLGRSDPLIADVLNALLDRGDFSRPLASNAPDWTPPGVGAASLETDPAIVAGLIAASEASLAELKREIRTKSGVALLEFIGADIQERKSIKDPRSLQVVMAGVEAAWWLNQHLQEWLGEKNVADTFAQSVAGNVTSEMGLALLDVADVIRPHREVVSFLERLENDDVVDASFLDDLRAVQGGHAAYDALVAWLERYGMRCVGEIDITRTRWSESPAMLVPLILGNVRNFEPGAAARRFEHGRQEARRKEQEVLERVRALPGGERKAAETKRMIDRVRTFAGYREYPKYDMVSRYFVYKRALMEEAARLVRAGALDEAEDIFWLRFDELLYVVRTGRVDAQLIRQRRDDYRSYQALTPPRVLTSDGEMLNGSHSRDGAPAGALVGLGVSAGTVEGRARVIADVGEADVEPGDILVTAYTDPSWTPVFPAIAGLVTEVGGLMTHGAVIAREYGLPAVVGVEQATRRIRDGQRIRLHGTDGYIEILP